MGILVVFFSVQRFGTDKIGYTFAPVVTVWLLLISGIGIYNVIKYDIGTLRAFNPKYIVDYFRRTKKKGWVSLGEILPCVTGTNLCRMAKRSHKLCLLVCHFTTRQYKTRGKPKLLVS